MVLKWGLIGLGRLWLLGWLRFGLLAWGREKLCYSPLVSGLLWRQREKLVEIRRHSVAEPSLDWGRFALLNTRLTVVISYLIHRINLVLTVFLQLTPFPPCTTIHIQRDLVLLQLHLLLIIIIVLIINQVNALLIYFFLFSSLVENPLTEHFVHRFCVFTFSWVIDLDDRIGHFPEQVDFPLLHFLQPFVPSGCLGILLLGNWLGMLTWIDMDPNISWSWIYIAGLATWW